MAQQGDLVSAWLSQVLEAIERGDQLSMKESESTLDRAAQTSGPLNVYVADDLKETARSAFRSHSDRRASAIDLLKRKAGYVSAVLNAGNGNATRVAFPQAVGVQRSKSGDIREGMLVQSHSRSV